MVKIEQYRVHHLPDGSVDEVNGRELSVVLVLEEDRQLDLSSDEYLINVGGHQPLLMPLGGGAHHFRHRGGNIVSLLRLPDGVGGRVGRRRGGRAAARARRADQKVVRAVDSVPVT